MLTEFPVRRWLNIILPLFAIALITALLLPAIEQSREAARRSQSRNNLKQWGLAIQNYAETHEVLPLGANVDTGGVAHHGWTTRLIPFLAQSILYSEFDFNQPWDSPRNEYLCRENIWINLNPSVPSPTSTTEGYALMHYAANPNLFHRNHCVGQSEISGSQAELWMLGEASGSYLPWAYPFNWRSLGSKLNSEEDGFGLLGRQGTFFVMADGSVRFIDRDIDSTVLRQLEMAGPRAISLQTAAPPRPASYRYSGNEREFSLVSGGDFYAFAYINRGASKRELVIREGDKNADSNRHPPSPTLIHELATSQSPPTRVLTAPIILDDEMMQVISQLTSLKSLVVLKVKPSPVVVEKLRTMPALQELRVCQLDDDTEALLRNELLNVTVGRQVADFELKEHK